MSPLIQFGSVVYVHNDRICDYKDGGLHSDSRRMRHPHVVTNFKDNSKVAVLTPFTSKGDCLHEKNVHHFIPAEAAPGLLNQPSWPLPHKDIEVPVWELWHSKSCLLNAVAMDIVLDYIDIYEDDWKVSKADAFIPFAGCNYPFSDVQHFTLTTASIYADLGMTPVHLKDALKPKFKDLSVKRITNKRQVA